MSNRTEREYWKFVSKEGLPIRRLPKSYVWGKDRSGRDIGTYSPDELEQRTLKQAKLSTLQLQHRQFLRKREAAIRKGESDLSSEEISQEKSRRRTMAALKRDLYGEITGSLAQDPEWDDVIPIPQNEPEGALAQIAYPDDYAEGTSDTPPPQRA